MKPRVIGITGRIGSGKTTLASKFVSGHGYTECAVADPIKEIAKVFGFSHNDVYGTQEQKLKVHSKWGISGREFCQKFGTEVGRNAIPSLIPGMNIERTVWVDITKERVRNNNDKWVLPDVRFKDEEELIKELGGIIIRTVKKTDSKYESGHASELEIDSIQPDLIIDNDALTKEEAFTMSSIFVENFFNNE